MISKKIIIPILTVGILGGAVAFGANQAKAQSNGNPLSGLVQMIAQKFGLDQNQVQSVVDQYRQQQKQNMQQKRQQIEQDRLGQLVQQGKITDREKQAILDELNTLKNKYNSGNLQNQSPQQRRQQMQAMQNDLKSWAQSQGIDPTLVLPGFGRMGRKSEGMGKWGYWQNNQPTPTPAK